MSSKSETAVVKFTEGYNCAQSVFYSFCGELGIDTSTALKTACGFGAGMGRKEEVCGAVSGGIMVIGIKYGRDENSGPAATETTYAKVRELMDRFSERHGTCICRRLLNGCELMTEEGQTHYLAQDYFNKVCRRCIRSVVDILEGII